MTYYIIDTNYPTSQRRVNKILNYVKKSLVDVSLMTFWDRKDNILIFI